ncbi:Pml1p ASCRUDRAFT_93498 [Ascoidea rubescens DSM 1968]|uniref:FHA domain-containing protein n=1 Tax=Ascoidea rubescens DSM 1968 TaxID=1344418 RepID=A0A1D2V8D4_9ASCO|nr:hypothetical protein ASCRUDRAFT_93498 [Ascoidea rubescens DSM 1968]ODV57890.1 hypothetical protein ASCRUDRAFT_93498 [Ascoidea rubescens DSM 1968]
MSRSRSRSGSRYSTNYKSYKSNKNFSRYSDSRSKNSRYDSRNYSRYDSRYNSRYDSKPNWRHDKKYDNPSSHYNKDRYGRRYSRSPSPKRYSSSKNRNNTSFNPSSKLKPASTSTSTSKSLSRSLSRSPVRSRSRSRSHSKSNHNALISNQKEILRDKPNFKSSGLLQKESSYISQINNQSNQPHTNIQNIIKNTTSVKYNEPADSIIPPNTSYYYLFIFKNAIQYENDNHDDNDNDDDNEKQKDNQNQNHLHSPSSKINLSNNHTSYNLFGRDQNLAHILLNHESCSNQHAVIQFRKIPINSNNTFNSDVSDNFSIKPYLIDLESTNNTFLNDKIIPPSRYIELKNQDIINFGDLPDDYIFITDQV